MDGITFYNRFDAGDRLSLRLESYQNNPDAIVLALPRGGVPVASRIAKHLNLPLDVFIVRKLGAPFQEELAMGALASGDVIFFNEKIISDLNVSQTDIKQIIALEKAELSRREKKYRQNRQFPNISKKIVILVDDGIATGANMHTAIIALRKLSPKKIIVAVPVAPREIVAEFAKLSDEMICLYPADFFSGVGAFYENFSQTTDEEVLELLRE